MNIKYIKPETVVVDVELQQIIAASPSPTLDPTQVTPTMDAKQFDLFATPEVEEENPNKNKLNQEEEWDEFEEEE